MTHQVLLYYKYVTIDSPEELRLWQRALCERLKLTGRILIAHEGINGTVEGTKEAAEEYRRAVSADPRFADMHWKISEGTGTAFPKLQVKVRRDIVSNAIEDWGVDPRKQTAHHMKPEELRALYESGEEFHIVDMRNDYEHASGHFAGSVLPPIGNFRELPGALPKLAHLKHKKVVTVCTGGVRCEKASALLLKHGFENVSQLDGGIVSYMEKYPNRDFKGKLYVFDKRVTMGFETDSALHERVGKCVKCGAVSEHYLNCGNLLCHRHYICCESCEAKNPCCSWLCFLRMKWARWISLSFKKRPIRDMV